VRRVLAGLLCLLSAGCPLTVSGSGSVAVAAWSCRATGPGTAAGYAALWAGSPGGVRSADGWWSARLPDGRTAWVTGDGIVDGRLVNNTLLVQCGSELVSASPGRPFLAPTDDRSWWGGAMVVDAGRLYSFVYGLREGVVTGVDLAVIRVPAGGQPVLEAVARTPASDRPEGGRPLWGASAVAWPDGYVYVYGQSRVEGEFGRAVYLARVPSGRLAQPAAWRYLSTGGVWRPDESQLAQVIAAHGGPDNSWTTWRDSAGRVAFVSTADGPWSDRLCFYTAPAPTGPYTFTERVRLPAFTFRHARYLAMGHPGQLPGGKTLVSVSRSYDPCLTDAGQPVAGCTEADRLAHLMDPGNAGLYRPDWGAL